MITENKNFVQATRLINRLTFGTLDAHVECNGEVAILGNHTIAAIGSPYWTFAATGEAWINGTTGRKIIPGTGIDIPPFVTVGLFITPSLRAYLLVVDGELDYNPTGATTGAITLGTSGTVEFGAVGMIGPKALRKLIACEVTGSATGTVSLNGTTMIQDGACLLQGTIGVEPVTIQIEGTVTLTSRDVLNVRKQAVVWRGTSTNIPSKPVDIVELLSTVKH